MNKKIRILMTPIAVLFIILGFWLEPRFVYWGISILLFAFNFVFYSGRKQRIRYWFQGYRRYLLSNKGNENKAISNLLEDFCKSKYGENLDVAEYFYIEPLIEEIIIREYKFNKYLRNFGEERYNKLITKLRKEIELIKNEILEDIENK